MALGDPGGDGGYGEAFEETELEERSDTLPTPQTNTTDCPGLGLMAANARALAKRGGHAFWRNQGRREARGGRCCRPVTGPTL